MSLTRVDPLGPRLQIAHAHSNYIWMRTWTIAVRALLATKFSLIMSHRVAVGAWDAGSTRVLRKKLFYELAVFILGSGNGLILVLFWPGWLLVGGALAVWQLSNIR